MKNPHFIKLPLRTVSVEIDERPDRVCFTILFSRYGDLGDLAEFQDHLRRLVEPYDADPRPTVMVNPKTGEEIFIVGDRTHCVAVIGPGGICHL